MPTLDSTSAAILTLLHLSAAAKLPVAARLVRRGLAREYPILAGSLVAGALIQGALLWSYWDGGWAAYGRMWARTTPLSFAVSMALALEALSVMARHFPQARNLAMLLIGIFGTLSLGVLLPLGQAIDSTVWLLAIRSYWKVGALATLGGAWELLRRLEPGMRQNARRYVVGLLICMAGSAAGDLVIGMSRPNYWGIAAGQFTLLLAPLAGYMRWWAMDSDGESYTPTKRRTLEELDEDTARIEEEIRAYGKGYGVNG